MDEQLNTLRQWLTESRRIAVFTGAGISTESGIPDFRSSGGLWDRFKAIDFQEYVTSEQARRLFWQTKLAMDEEFTSAEPNRGHRAVAELVRRGQCHAVITQNVDGLHQAAGADSDTVIELHGNNTYATCLSCDKRFELAPIKAAFRVDGTLPACDDCGGLVKTATISFGQAMPEQAMAQAEAATFSADLFLVLGSSLVVYPAAGFPRMALETGARLVIINRDPTDLDPLADLVLHREIGPTLGEAVGVD